jgi:hypothetical protein
MHIFNFILEYTGHHFVLCDHAFPLVNICDVNTANLGISIAKP